MNMYPLLKPFLFSLEPEQAHDFSMATLHRLSSQPWLLKKVEHFFAHKVPALPINCMGLDFKHPIGLAAGLDKDARALPTLAAFGFSAVELGTVTPKPQAGNDKPRMFRLLEDEALINRMGFNSSGLEKFLGNLPKQEVPAVVGINVGKNAVTAIEDAHYDYVSALQRVYSHADYITINISSPNTKSLRDLQNEEYLDNLLIQIGVARVKCEKVHKRHVPIALKVAPDLHDDEIETIADLLLSHQFDGLIASNTTVSRPASLRSKYAEEGGGLSGAPVRDLATDTIRKFYRLLQGQVQIIGVGGIASAEDAWDKLLAGADMLQIYTHFIYQGPSLIREIVVGLEQRMRAAGFSTIEEAMTTLRAQS